jgi:large subunit ribosomal protein L24
MKLKIKKGDKVAVISGSQKGKTGKVLSVDVKKMRVTIEGVAMRKHHEKAKPNNPGGIVTKEGSVHYSNVLLVDEKSGKPTRVGYKITVADGGKTKERISKRSGAVI